MMKTKYTLLLLFFPLCIYAKTNSSCAGNTTVHPVMLSCIQGSTNKVEDSIKSMIEKHGSEYSVTIDFYNAQRK